MALRRSIYLLLLAGVMLVAGGGCASTPDADGAAETTGVGSYAKAKRAYRSGDYLLAAEGLIPLAEGGDPRAQYALGYMYYYGKGVLADRERAVDLFRRAARQGNQRAAEALRMLAEPVPDSPSVRSDLKHENVTERPGSETELAQIKKNALDSEAPEISKPDARSEARSEQPPVEPRDTEIAVPMSQAAVSGESQSEEVTGTSTPRSQHQPYSSEWLRERDPDHLTIQLVAGRDYSSVRGFIDEHGLQGRAAIVSGRRNDKVWYVVLYGDYATSEEARMALDGLPASLSVNGPWIRRLGDALDR